MRKRSNRMNNGYVGGPAYPQPYVDSGGIINAYKWYVTTVDISLGEWKRPDYWLSLPNMIQGDQKFAGLYGVFKGASGNTGTTADSNYVALMIRLQNTGHSYFVDWGDGNVTRHAHNTNAQYQYNWANIDSATETPQGYRQVVIQAYPQTGGTMTMFDLRPGYVASGVTLNNQRSSGWLDIRISGPELTQLYIGQYATNNFRNYMLKQVHVVGTTKVNNPGVFINCQAIERVIGTEWTENITDATHFFSSNLCLRHIPLLDTRKMTGMLYFCLDARSLERFPPLNTSNVTVFQQMFSEGGGQGGSLRSVPILNTSKVQNWTTTFERQRQLTSIPNLDFSAATNLFGTFSQCTGLRYVPPIIAPNATTLQQTFNRCNSLESVPGLSAPNNTTLLNTFFDCYSLKNIPEMDTSKVRDFSSAFNGCFSIERLPSLNTSAGVTFTTMCSGMISLAQAPQFNLNGASAGSTAAGAGPLNGMFSAGSLRIGTMLNTRRSISYANMILSATELNSIFTNLADVSAHGATITITNNWGTATCNRSIATSKGWTVVG